MIPTRFGMNPHDLINSSTLMTSLVNVLVQNILTVLDGDLVLWSVDLQCPVRSGSISSKH